MPMHWLSTKVGQPTARFTRSQRGNVAIIFAMTLLPMIGMIGIGIDVGRTLTVRTALQAAADAGALAAATEAESTMQAGGNTATAQYAGQVAGQQVFYSNVGKVSRWLSATPTPTVSVNPGSANITAFVSYATPVPTIFGGFFGTPNFNVAGNAASSLALPKYLNISVVTDISQSMGLAATSAGQTQLASITGGCQFGCHAYQSGQNGSLPYEVQAHTANPPVQLRIDVIRQATQNMIQTAQQLATSTPYISFGLYTLQGGNGTIDAFGQKSDGKPLATMASPSTNYTSLYAAAGTLDLGDNTSAGVGDTDYADAMTALTSTVPTSGSGSSGSPQQFVFLMTDGVDDVWTTNYNCPSGTYSNGSHCTQAFDPSTCTALKNKNVTIGVIYTTYLSIAGVQSFDTLVQPFWSSLPTKLQSCASPGWFYQASDANDIQVAINALFAKATGHGVLTQ